METVEIKIKIPKEVFKAIPDFSDYSYEKLIPGLYQGAEISLGKAAELLQKTPDEFIQYLGKHKIAYFRNTNGEIQKELNHLTGI